MEAFTSLDTVGGLARWVAGPLVVIINSLCIPRGYALRPGLGQAVERI